MFDVRLKELRELKGLTQKDLAHKLNLTQSTIAYYESGKKLPTVDTLLSLAKFFYVSTDFLLGLSEGSNSPDTLSQNNLNEATNYQTSTLTSEHRKILRYFDRLSTENKELIIGKMIELYKEQPIDSEITRELERYRLELLSKNESV
ncbi:helix-turn-helix domain-containing protein [Anaerocolumna chitinilytica]|uniref:Transcriptional regulator n=1 Tax=Anaerocolumna chitinilytica TaxID=1727145 RepID=A0A7I8DH48_9FIRM|nr:helix-turn-helix transcriptional regulator [Anaerocolumna chitinilytica]BCJ97690.1 transcriptional regulator [Anaerocolumna chitinilytica]